MTTGRETAGSNERSVELIFLGLTTYKTNDGTDVMNLGRPLGIHTTAMVGAYDGIASLQQRLHNGTQVGSTLAAVREPSTTIDMDDHWIGCFLFFRQIDVTGMVGLIIASIVNIFPLLRGGEICFRCLEATKTSGRLCHGHQRQARQDE